VSEDRDFFIVALAERRGLIPPWSHADEATPSERLTRIVREGLLSEDMVAALARELSQGTPEHTTVSPGEDGAGAAAIADATAPGVGRYERLELLGSGGMGQVFRAYDRLLARPVALKVLKRGAEGAVERFLREARAQARVEHPHVCKVYEVITDGAEPCISMQLISGAPLLTAAAGKSVAAKVALFSGAVRGVEAAHALGLIHRDLKPSNILVEGDHAYVADFGIAVDADQAPEARGVAGTPAYMSPEQASGERAIDQRSDVYGLGATLYALLAGAPPFEGPSRAGRPPSLREQCRDVPRDLELVVARCLEPDPERRYPSARALAEDLERFLAGEPVLAHPASLTYRLGKRLRRQRALAVGVVLALLGVGVATAGLRAARHDNDPGKATAGPRAAMPTNPVAARRYTEGLEKLRKREAAAAIEALRASVAAEPRFAPAYAAIADASWTLGREAEARAAAQQAVELSERRAPAERTLAEARLLETSGEPERAAELYERLWLDYPDDVEYGINLGMAYRRAGNAAGERRVLREIMRVPAAAGDPRVDLLQLTVAFEDGNRELAWTLAERMIEKGRAQGADAQTFAGVEYKAVLLWSKGQYDEAVAHAREAIRLATRLGDRQGAAWNSHLLGRIELDRGRVVAAEAAFAAMEVAGLETRIVLKMRLEGLGRAALARGDLPAATRLLSQALDAADRSEGATSARSSPLYWLGATALAAGDLVEARRRLDESAKISRDNGWRGGIAECDGLLAIVDLEEGQLARARGRLQNALAIWQERQAPIEQERVRLTLARVSLREGSPAVAETAARQAVAWFEQHSLADDRALAAMVLVEALVAQGRRAEAAGQRAGLEEIAADASLRGHVLLARRATAAAKGIP
jgi:tetratricopeptide (TPR) repeat protein